MNDNSSSKEFSNISAKRESMSDIAGTLNLINLKLLCLVSVSVALSVLNESTSNLI